MHVHVVQKGDTLWKIARQYGVSFDEVKRLNAHLANPDYIVPGMKIFVPEKAAKMQEKAEHPFHDNRPVKSLKEGLVEPMKKAVQLPMPQPLPKAMPQPMPQPMLQPMPQPMPQPMLQPMPQPMPQPYPYPISQDISMTNIMPQIMGVPYGFMPVPDVDATHVPQPLPPKAMHHPVKKMPLPEKPIAHIPTTKLPGWKLDDSSSLGYDMSSSLEMPVLPQYTQMQQAPMEMPCGCSQQHYVHHRPSPCGCGHVDYQQQYQYPTQMREESPESYMPMQQQHPYMMSPQMMPYMACTPCHMLPAHHGQWGFPVRYN